MKQIIKSTIIVILIFSFSSIKGQSNISDFTLTSNNVSSEGQNIELSTTMTKTENTIVWTQLKNGVSDSSNFTITDLIGYWDESSSIGELIFSLVSEQNDCVLILTGQSDDLSATLIYLLDGVEDDRYLFDINSISYN
jgi:hypothetical protein